MGVFGGRHADVPIAADMGAAAARGSLSCGRQGPGRLDGRAARQAACDAAAMQVIELAGCAEGCTMRIDCSRLDPGTVIRPDSGGTRQNPRTLLHGGCELRWLRLIQLQQPKSYQKPRACSPRHPA